MYLKEVYLLIIFVICLLLQASYIRIILEIATLIFFTYQLIFETSRFGFKDLNFSTR